MIEAAQTVGEIVREHPASARVFGRHRIDFCCGGGIPLAEACAARDVDVSALISELRREVESPAPLESWVDRPTAALIEHILERYHRPLDDELPRLEMLADKVARVHGDWDERFPLVAATFHLLRMELENHFLKEEQILFPALLSGETRGLACPVAVMLRDHEDAGDLLRDLRTLTDDYAVPPGACGSVRALWQGLEDLERSLFEHIYLENEVLFPRVEAR